MEHPAKIDLFRGEWEAYSNFYIPAPVELDGVTYVSVEHAYQAAKTLNPKKREPFTWNVTSAKAKSMGGKLKPIREDWEAVKADIMYHLLLQKFSKPPLRDKLLNSGSAILEEGNWWHDVYWGVCYGGLPDGFHGRKCKKWPHDPIGENHLGRLLMGIRAIAGSHAILPDGQPCDHAGCLNHVTHPCEGCGRVAGWSSPWKI